MDIIGQLNGTKAHFIVGAGRSGIPIGITYLSTQLLMKHYYSLPLGVRNFLIKYLKLRH